MTTVKEVLESALAEAVTALDAIERQWKELDEERGRVLKERDGLLLAIERHTGAPAALSTATETETNTWTRMNRTDAVLAVLREAAGDSMPPARIAQVLTRHGRAGDTPALVSSSLSKLQTQGRAERSGYGKWSLPSLTDTSGPDESGPEAGVTAMGEGGGPHAQADRDHGVHLFQRDNDDRDDRGGAPVEGLTS